MSPVVKVNYPNPIDLILPLNMDRDVNYLINTNLTYM